MAKSVLGLVFLTLAGPLAPAQDSAPGSAPPPKPPDLAAFRMHADKARTAAGLEWTQAAEYFCAADVRVNAITDPAIEPTRLFDDLWALGDEGTTVYAVTTPEGIVLLDALYPEKLESVLLPQMMRAGLDPGRVKYVLISHGHSDHFGGAAYFQARGAKVVLSAADWVLVEKARMPAGRLPPRREVEIADGGSISLGGKTFTAVYVPGHTPGSLAWIFPVTDHGTPHLAGMFGSTILRNMPLSVEALTQELGSWEKWADITRAKQVDVELQNHPFFDGMPAKLAAVRNRGAKDPNPFVVGAASYGRFTQTVTECLRADIARKGGN